ncbi:MAG: hypothetical protein GY870_04365 [archaeon]|nr:hypothetical protein [archaeon]
MSIEKKEIKKESKGKNENKKSNHNNFILLLFLILFIIYDIYLVNFLLDSPETPGGLSNYIIGNKILDIIQIFILPPFISIIMLFFAILIVPIYIKFAVLLKSNKYKVAFQDYSKKITTKNIIGKILFCTIFSLSLSLTFNGAVYQYGFQFLDGAQQAYCVSAMALFITPISVVILAPTWILEDIGIIFFKKQTENETYDITSIGRFYSYLLKGYAGITTPVMYLYAFFSDFQLNIISELNIVLLFEPFFLIGSYSLTLWAYTIIFPKIKTHYLKKAKYPELKVKIELRN